MRSKRSKNSTQNSPNAAQKRWLDLVAGSGSIVDYAPCVIHHMWGATAQVKGVGNIGHWSLLPLTPYQHDLYHHDRTEFERRYGGQKELFLKLIRRFRDMPFEDDVLRAILSYHR